MSPARSLAALARARPAPGLAGRSSRRSSPRWPPRSPPRRTIRRGRCGSSCRSPPAGPADVYARFLAQRLQESLGQPFVVDNRPGAGSIIGTDAVAKSPPDGYTLLLMSNTHTVNESLIPNKPFQLMRDFVPVAPINYSDLVLVARIRRCRRTTLGRADRAREGEARASSTTRRRGRARRITWPASCSRRWPASTSCTSRTRAARARAPTCSAARWT